MSKLLPPSPVVAADEGPAPSPPLVMGTLAALVSTARPKQWVKNVLVFAAPGAAGVLTHGHALEASAGAFAVFCVVASGTYFLNDCIDANADRHHPLKRHRPIAAQALSRSAGVAVGVGLIAVGLAATPIISWRLTVVVAAYVAVVVAYSLRLKQEPIFDIASVAAGFVLRAIAGGVAAGVPISQWFLIVAMFGSLMMVTGKRAAEYAHLGDTRGAHRVALDSYTEGFLRTVLIISAAVAVTAYCLWAFERQAALGAGGDGIWYQLSIVPFVLAILRYALIVENGNGGQPTDVVLSDRALLVAGGAWVALFALGVYVH